MYHLSIYIFHWTFNHGYLYTPLGIYKYTPLSNYETHGTPYVFQRQSSSYVLAKEFSVIYIILCTAAVWGQPDELVQCFTDNDCFSETTPLPMTRRECCVDTPDGTAFRGVGIETCNICTGT